MALSEWGQEDTGSELMASAGHILSQMALSLFIWNAILGGGINEVLARGDVYQAEVVEKKRKTAAFRRNAGTSFPDYKQFEGIGSSISFFFIFMLYFFIINRIYDIARHPANMYWIRLWAHLQVRL